MQGVQRGRKDERDDKGWQLLREGRPLALIFSVPFSLWISDLLEAVSFGIERTHGAYISTIQKTDEELSAWMTL